MRVDTFDFQLPDELIATHPPDERDGAKMLHVAEGGLVDRRIVELPSQIAPGTLLVVNDTRVLPARLLGKKASTGGAVELLLVRKLGPGDRVELGADAPAGSQLWLSLGKASKPLRAPSDVSIDEKGELAARVVGKGDDGLLVVALYSPSGREVDEALAEHGHVPLPPYMKRPDSDDDRQRYQTVFARVPGAVAAPTAGLHLSERLLSSLEARGVKLARVTLHVGLGTFKPVQVDDLDEHPMHEEWMDVPGETAQAVADARARGARVMAVGTTVVRALESAADGAGGVRPTMGPTRLLIQPGYRFGVVDAMLTNFHLPKSTLLALVCAFGGTSRVLEAYRHAVAERYRFYSYGDAMLLTARVLAERAAS